MPPPDFRKPPPTGGLTVILPGAGQPGAPEPAAGQPGPQNAAPPDAARHFRRQLEAGAPWHRALLETIGIWTLPQETWHGRRYQYIIGREAFDWLLLAERLCHPQNTRAAAPAIPPRQLERLLFHGILPEPIEPDEFRALLGPSKHQAYLNYHYGITLEEALQLAAEESARKRHTARGYADTEELTTNDAFRHLYNDTPAALYQQFTRAANAAARPTPNPDPANATPDPAPTPAYPELIEGRPGLSLTGLKEFTYWLHKRRVNYWDPARVASDTRQAIRRLTALQETAAPPPINEANPPGSAH